MDNLEKLGILLNNAITALGKKLDILLAKDNKPVVNFTPPEVIVPDIVVPEIKMPEFPPYPAFPEYPPFPEIKVPVPIVNVPKPDPVVVNVEPPIVNLPPANITVTPTPVEFPKEMEVKGIDKLIEAVNKEPEQRKVFDEVSSKSPLPIMVIGKDGKQITEFGGDMTAPSVVGLKIGTEQISSANPLPVTEGLNLPVYDYISMTYTGSNLTEIIYKLGGASGTTVATLTMTYSGSNLISVTKT